MWLLEVKGDLVEMFKRGQVDVMVHGCNTFCTMGAGIARQVSKEFPEAYEADCKTVKGDMTKLGTYTQATVATKDKDGNPRTGVIVNAYTQHSTFGKDVLFEYEHFPKLLEAIKKEFTGQRIGFPWIGAGLAGGDWEIIRQMIIDGLQGEEVVLVEFPIPAPTPTPTHSARFFPLSDMDEDPSDFH